MKKLLDKIPYDILIVFAVILAIVPISPEPHLVEKVRMLLNGTLSKGIDIFDLIMHSSPLLLLAMKAIFSMSKPK